jgi:uncharacterized protein (DUF302 family)
LLQQRSSAERPTIRSSASEIGPAMITKTSSRSVPETVERLTEELASRGIKLFVVVDHSGEAETAGLELRDTKLVVFGSPAAGTPVMAAAPLAAIDLPLKVLVWDDEGETKLSYVSPEELADRHGLSPHLGERLSAIHVITDAVVGTEQHR